MLYVMKSVHVDMEHAMIALHVSMSFMHGQQLHVSVGLAHVQAGRLSRTFLAYGTAVLTWSVASCHCYNNSIVVTCCPVLF